MFAGASGFNRGIQGKQVGLFGQIIDHLNDLSDVIGALAKDIDDFARRANRAVDLIQPFRGFLHRVDSAVHLLARAVGDIEENFGSIGDSLNRSDHLIDGC